MAEGAASPTVAVLCFFDGHRCPIDITQTDGKSPLENVEESVRAVFSDLIPTYLQNILQINSQVWKGEFVDIRENDSIPNQSIVRVLMKREPSDFIYESLCL